jgi:mono/diheme cytochrome c family protein
VPHPRWRLVGLTLIAITAGALAGAALLIRLGVYDISATEQHTTPVYRLMEITLRYSVQRRARDITAPALNEAGLSDVGLSCFARHCAGCHGAPGLAGDRFALTLQPLPRPLTDAVRQWRANELFWIVRHGVKMTGMPAWRGQLTDQQIWAIVAFLHELPLLAPVEYRARAASASAPQCDDPRLGAGRSVAMVSTGRAAVGLSPEPTAEAALDALRQYGCHACHRIPGIVGPEAVIGPPLARFGTRALVAGRWPNTEANVVQWIRWSQQLDPRSAMPDLAVSEHDALVIARFLRSLQ